MTLTAAQDPATADERMQKIYTAHSTALMRLLLKWTLGDWQAAEDLMQETMMRAWRHLDSLNPDVDALRPWLATVARRAAMDRYRARGVRPAETEADPLDTLAEPSRPLDQLLDRDELRGIMTGLSAAHRAALVEVYVRDQTVPEAAVVLGVPEGTVKSRLHHALRAVRGSRQAQTACA